MEKTKMKRVGKFNDEDYSSSDRENEPKVRLAKRGKRFSQMETDLLLSMVMSSNINSMETNKMTNKGRSMGWELITISFNASPCVMQRTEKELRDRTSNIRKDLYKLSRFQKESTQATGGGHLPPRKPPSVSFDLSEVVKKYAVSLQVKLAGLAPVDSDRALYPVDETTSTPTTSPIFNLFNSEVVSPIPILSTPALTEGALATTAPSHDEINKDMPSTSNTSAMSLPCSSSQQMFATQGQRRRKLNSSNSNLTNSDTTKSSSPSETYLENKSKLLADENQRRNEWHKLCMKIKNEELAIKKKQSQFWSLIISDVNRNQTNISDIVARAMDNTNPINYDVSYPTEQSFSAFERSSPLNANEAHAEQSADDMAHAETDMYENYESLSSIDDEIEEDK